MVREKYNFGINEDDKSQRFQYANPGFPVYIQRNLLKDGSLIPLTDHWHDEVEMFYVFSGSLKYSVDGETLCLKENEGIFVNSRRLHVALSDDGKPCDFIFVIFHPLLLCTSRFIDEKYVEPIIKNPSIPYIFLNQDGDWKSELLEDIKQMYEQYKTEEGELKLQSLFFKFWRNLYHNLRLPEDSEPVLNHHLATLKEMISYIHEHYKDKVSLEDISRSGSVGKTMCTFLFNQYVNKTPGEFLKDYRIQKSTVLLKTTDMSITDISYETGFAGASYFSETFKKSVGCTPNEYRKNNADKPVLHFYR